MDSLTVYYDYTCRYSYRAMHWMDRVRAGRPNFEVHWATFSLKEVNRSPEEPSWVDPDSPPSISILAFALAHAARVANFEGYHRTVFEAMQGEERHLSEEDLLAIAKEAGVDTSSFDRAGWTGSVGAEHRHAVEQWGVYGTPTVILENGATYIRLHEEPGSSDEALVLVDALDGIASSRADLVEFFRPEGPKPTPVQIGQPPVDG